MGEDEGSRSLPPGPPRSEQSLERGPAPPPPPSPKPPGVAQKRQREVGMGRGMEIPAQPPPRARPHRELPVPVLGAMKPRTVPGTGRSEGARGGRGAGRFLCGPGGRVDKALVP